MSITSISTVHRNEDGSISIMAVFMVMLLTMLLGMIMNVGRQVDGKIRMQNAADAAAYSGGLVLTRGMNTLAFTNHLLCDIIATTAFLREARDRNSEAYVPFILDAWEKEGPVFARSGFPKFNALGAAIPEKAPLEQELVRSYSEWSAAASERILPLLEEILAKELIPQYQRAVVKAFPDIAQAAAMNMANRESQRGRGKMLGVLWRTSGQPVGGDEANPVLPVVDPITNAQYAADARKQRAGMVNHYLALWNGETLLFFNREAKMSRFSTLWRSFTCGQKEKLLKEEYPTTNLPMMLRTEGKDILDSNSHLDQHFTFLAVTYWKKLPGILPKIFSSSTPDSVTYATVQVFLPLARIEWWQPSRGGSYRIGGVPGEFPPLPPKSEPPAPPSDDRPWKIRRQPIPQTWNLWNQQWTCQLAPTTLPNLVEILRTKPPGSDVENFQLPDFSNLSPTKIGTISTH